MCTLSWLPEPGGFRLFINRDERRTRARGLAPRLVTIGGTGVLAPVDGDFGGTWVGVNQFGLAVAILNRYQDTPARIPAEMVSRGLLVRDLLAGGRTPGGVWALLGRTDLRRYLPFTVAAIGRGGPVLIADWTGRRLSRSGQRLPGIIRTSSGRDQARADATRRTAFAARFGTRPPTPAALRAFHRSHLPARGPFSVCMHREEAKTQSLTELRVGRTAATIRYAAGSPCRARLSTPRRLRLRPR